MASGSTSAPCGQLEELNAPLTPQRKPSHDRLRSTPRAPGRADAAGRGGRAADRAGSRCATATRDYPYRHDSYFYYLTGFSEPESVLVLVAAPGDTPARAILFCREKNLEREIWDGYRYGPEAARAAFGFDEAYPIGELDARMPRPAGQCAGAVLRAGRQRGARRARAGLDDRPCARSARSGVTAPAHASTTCCR